ncbi:hypothetical protein TD95_004529 [Thielaviopsis punctulata]|uniref:Large ribosomal subunit protein mL46 n=1 Tax=Thielaviopsis punctulata TaxID=72032 RepID=A0A0F4ZDZ2_9PEZI|nr:hypothetical protein TD95_004529 [Thielaviopsis punctulata]
MRAMLRRIQPLPYTTARFYSAAAAPAPTPASAPADAAPPTPTPSHTLKAGIILTRAPLLTAEPTAFESAFWFYQKRLNERLCLPFSQKFYFKPDTPGQLDWAIKLRERKGIVAREVGAYNGKSSTAWNDELLVGDELSSPRVLTETLLKDAELRVSEDAEEIPEEDRQPVERPQPRRSKADETGDVKRLDREMDRTLYLVVQEKSGEWVFPAVELAERENLHIAAKRAMDSSAGINMNTWMVGRVPVAHVVDKTSKTFFLKGRIMAGQADLKDNTLGLKDFKWLTREELEKTFKPEYYKGVRNMMADR